MLKSARQCKSRNQHERADISRLHCTLREKERERSQNGKESQSRGRDIFHAIKRPFFFLQVVTKKGIHYLLIAAGIKRQWVVRCNLELVVPLCSSLYIRTDLHAVRAQAFDMVAMCCTSRGHT